MRVAEQINAVIWSWAGLLRAGRHRAAFAPFVIYGLAQVLVLCALIWFAYPPFSYFMVPAMRGFFGEAALHYPNNFLVLGTALGQFDAVLSVLLGSVVVGAGAYLFAAFYGGSSERLGRGWHAAATRYISLVAVAAVVAVSTQLITRIPLSNWDFAASGSPARFRVMRTVLIGTAAAIQALFIYAYPHIVLGRRGFRSAMGKSARWAVRNPITTYLLVAVPLLLELVPAWFVKRGTSIVTKMAPEVLALVMLVWVAVIVIVGYAITGGATRFYLFMVSRDRDHVSGP